MAKDVMQVARGIKAELPQLLPGQLGFCVDTEEVFIGNGDGDENIPLGAKGEQGERGEDGVDGTSYIPNVSPDGTLSWTNDGGFDNPPPVNLKGEKGDAGAKGADGKDGADAVTDTELSLTSENAIANRAVAKMFDGLPPTVRITGYNHSQYSVTVDTELKGHNSNVYFLCMKGAQIGDATPDTIWDGYQGFAVHRIDNVGNPSTPAGLSAGMSYLIKPYDDGVAGTDGWEEAWKVCIVKEIQGEYSSYLDYLATKLLPLIEGNSNDDN